MALIKSRPVAAFRVFACWRGSGEDVPPPATRRAPWAIAENWRTKVAKTTGRR